MRNRLRVLPHGSSGEHSTNNIQWKPGFARHWALNVERRMLNVFSVHRFSMQISPLPCFTSR